MQNGRRRWQVAKFSGILYNCVKTWRAKVALTKKVYEMDNILDAEDFFALDDHEQWSGGGRVAVRTDARSRRGTNES